MKSRKNQVYNAEPNKIYQMWDSVGHWRNKQTLSPATIANACNIYKFCIIRKIQVGGNPVEKEMCPFRGFKKAKVKAKEVASPIAFTLG